MLFSLTVAIDCNDPYRRGMPKQVALEVMSDEVRRGYWYPGMFEDFYKMMKEDKT